MTLNKINLETRAADFLAELKRKNIQLWVEDASLRYKAPKGEMTPAIISYLKERKTELIQLLRAQAESPENTAAIFYDPIPKAPLESFAASVQLTGAALPTYPPSSAQKRMFILNQLNPEQTSYNLTRVLKLKGPVQLERIKAVIGQIVDRHEILRTSFELQDGNLIQRIHPKLDFKIEFMEMNVPLDGGVATDFSDGAAEDAVEDLIWQFIRPYDLKQPPLFRIRLVKLDGLQDTYLLLYDTHHIISDGVSLGVFTQEINDLYAGRVLPSVAVQYKDFTLWHEKLLNSDFLKAQKEYWRKKFQGEIPALNLPTDHQRPRVYQNDGGTVKQRIALKQAAAVNQLARKNQATLYQTLFSAFYVLLARLTGQTDLVVGTPTAGRRHADLDDVMGVFVNTLAIRAYPEWGKRFQDFLVEFTRELLIDFDNQDYQFENLVEELKIERDLSRNPLFDVMFILQNMKIEPVTGSDLEVSPYEFQRKMAPFDLTLTATEHEQGIELELNYASHIFEARTAERFLEYYLNILAGVIQNPQVTIGAVELLSEAEKQLLLYRYNGHQSDYSREKTLSQIFEEQVERTPDYVAVTYEAEKLTYRELNRKANQIAKRLRNKGVAPDMIVGIIAERSLAMIIGILGILKAGGAYLPIDPEYPEERIRFILEDSQAGILLIQSHFMANHHFEIEMVELVNRVEAPDDDLNLKLNNQSHDLAYVIYTSGTTGKPKGVMIEHKSVVNLAHSLGRIIYRNYGPGLKITLIAPYVFDASVKQIFAALLDGHHLVIIPEDVRMDGEKLLHYYQEKAIDISDGTPIHIKLLADALVPVPREIGVKHFIIGGETLQAETVKSFYAGIIGNKPYITNVYGPTECCVDATSYSMKNESDIQSNSIPLGTPLANTQIYILDQNLKIAPLGVFGEIYISGEGVARGYLNQLDLTAEKFVVRAFRETPVQRIYRTGDLARWLPGGNIEFWGRIDHQVKIRGFRVELGEIESRLLALEPVREAVVVAIEKADAIRENQAGIALEADYGAVGADKYLCAYIVADRELSVSELRKDLGQTLPQYMIPTYFVQLDILPVNSNGKVDRKALAAGKYDESGKRLEPEGMMGTSARLEAPLNEVELKLGELWREVLGLQRVGMNDNFFEVGGHSLKAAILVARILKEFNAEISLRQVFQWQTIKEQAKYLATARRSIFSAIEPASLREYYPASAAQKRMYILNQLEKDTTSYNIPGVVEIEGLLARNRVEETIWRLIERHESLRTSFTMMDSEPVQQVHPKDDARISAFRIEYQDMADDVRNGHARSLPSIIRDFIRPFDLSKAPLLRVGLIKLAPDHHLLIYDMSHIISDGVSMNILIQEFAKIYNREALPELRIQYKDYAAWQAKERGSDSQAGAWQAKERGSNSQAEAWQAKERGSNSQAGEWQNQLFQFEAIERQKAYWLNAFAGEIPVLNLPTDYPRPAIQSFAGDRFEVDIDETLARKLYELAAQTGTTIYMLLLAAYTTLLFKYTGQEDIITGSPIAGRGHADLENIIGMFVNTLAMRNYPEAAKKFRDYLVEVKQNALDAYENQDYQFEELVEKLNLRRDLSRNPLFDTVLVLQNMGMEALEIPGLKISPYSFDNPVAKFDLTLTATETTQGFHFELEYCTALFMSETIERLAGHFRNLLHAITVDPDIELAQIEIMTEAEREQILYEFNDTQAGYPKEKTIHQLFEEQVERTPEQIAVFFEAERLTYRDLNEKANQLANLLRGKGIRPDSIIGIMVERSLTMIVAILGILKAGGAYLPVDPEYPRARISFMLEDSEALLLLTQHHLKEKAMFHGEIVDLDDVINYRGAGLNPKHSGEKPLSGPGDLAYVIYTSGTTGKPKGAMIEHWNVVRLLFNEKLQFEFNASDTWTMFHSFCFDFSVWEMYGALLYGGQLVIAPKSTAQDPGAYLRLLKEYRVTVLNQTPTAFYNLINEELKCEDRSLAVRYVIFGGEALQPAMLKEWREKYPQVKLINMYGITETTVHVTYKEITLWEIEQNISNIGKPIPTLTTYVVDRGLRLLPIGIPGELCVGGDGVGRGYLNRPELTAEKFVEQLQVASGKLQVENQEEQLKVESENLNITHQQPSTFNLQPSTRFYRSGDLARFLSNGDLEYLGRIDQQVKIRGHRIELQEIETVVLQYEPVKEAVVIAREDAEGNKYLCAYYVAESAISVAGFREYLGLKLPEYMIPAYFVPLDKIPLTPNHKIDRKALPEPGGGIRGEQEYEAPRNETEAKLMVIWQEALKNGSFGTKDNFFYLGGDSIKAIHLISSINEVFQTNILIKDLYLHQTIQELSEYLQTAPRDPSSDLEDGLRLIQEMQKKIRTDANQAKFLPEGYEDFYPLSFIQQGMVFFTKLRPEEPVYHDQFPYLFKIKQFNLEAFNSALKFLIQKHPILRTTFHLEQFSEPIQVVHSIHSKIIPSGVVVEDSPLSEPASPLSEPASPLSEPLSATASPLKATAGEERIREYLANDLQNKFTFGNELLWRVRLFDLGRQDYCLIFTVQHAILDGWSMASLIRELVEAFERLLRGESLEPEPLKSSYKDYVAINLSRKNGARALEFWKEYLAGYTRNKLPFNISNRKITNTGGSRILRRSFNPQLEQGLEQKARDHQSTLPEICLAAHVYLLGIITTETDIVTGVVSHDRPAIADGDKILGCFLNTVPVRIHVETEIKKADLLETVASQLRNVKFNELFLADIAEIIGERNASGNPVFDTLHNFTDFHVLKGVAELGLAEPVTREVELQPNEMTNTLFDLEVSRTLEIFSLQIKYAPDYFHDQDITAAADLYQRILEAIAFDDDPYLRSEALLTREQIKELVFDFNRTQTEYPREKTMHRMFEEQVHRTPEQAALVMGDSQLTYRGLNEASNQLAHLLMERGVRSGDHVALVIRRSFTMITGMMAILKCGGAYVPIDPEYPATRKQYIADNSKVTAILTGERYPDIEHDNIIVMDESNLKPYSTENPVLAKDSRDLAYVIYTSGSTGVPKGVMIEHHSAVNLILWVNREFRVNEEDALLFITSMCFDLSVYDIFGTLAVGAKAVIAEKGQVQDPDELKRLLLNHRITFWDSVPSTMNYLVNALTVLDEGYQQKSLRLVFLSGDWIPVSLPGRLLRHFPNAKVISLGGATEGTVWSIYYPVESVSENQASIPYGRPIANNYFYILDRNLKVVPKGVAGELYIGGVGVARGYMNDEQRTKASFMPDRFLDAKADEPIPMMYKTGDLGRMLPDGNIEFLGRMDHQVKIRGYRVELGEIENRLIKHPAVREAVVVDQVDASGNKYLCAYLVRQKAAPVAEIKEYLAKELPDYMIPNHILSIEQIPLTSNGKIDRKALASIAKETGSGKRTESEGNASTGTGYMAARSRTEAALAEIWREVLGIEQVNIKDDFFELGGHSLKATILATQIHKRFNLEIPLREIFTHSTLEGLADYIEKVEKTSIYAAIQPVPLQEYYALSAAQKRMYILNQLEGAGITYNTPGAVTIEGKLERPRLEEVFRRLIARHESFRTSFEVIDGEPAQRIEPAADERISTFKIEFWDLAECEDSNPRIHARSVPSIIRDFIRPFDLQKAPLLRAGLIKLAQDRHLLIYDMHHIISDGTSMGILIREFVKAYNGEALPELRIQYKDYSAWQAKEKGINSQAETWQAKEKGSNSQAEAWQAEEKGSNSQVEAFQNKLLQSGAIQREEAYWLNTFSGEIPALNLPTDYPRPAIQSFAGDRLEVEIDEELTRKLYELAAQTGTTIYMLLLAAYTTLLFRYTGQEDMVVGSPIAGRGHADLENVIGMFVNTLAMRNYPEASKKFHDFLNEVKQNAMAAFENQDYPFEELVEKLNLRRDLSRNPLFDTMFVLQNMEMAALEIPGLKISPYHFDNPIAKFDLTLTAEETKPGIHFRFEYCTALYRQETIRRLAGHFINILESVTGDPEVSLAAIEITSSQERQRFISEFNDTQAEYPRAKTIHRLFEEQVERTPERIAINDNAETLTYRELNRKANQLARTLREKGVTPNQIVVIMAEPSLKLIIGMMGILKAGGAYLPIDPEYPWERIRFMLEDSGANLIITQDRYLESRPLLQEILEFNTPEIYHPDHSNLEMVNQPDDLVYLIYTSGSTGQPKGVMIMHQGLVNYIWWAQKVYCGGEQFNFPLYSSISFDLTVTSIYTPLITGNAIIIYSIENKVAALPKILADQRVQILKLTPTDLQLLNEMEIDPPDHPLKFIVGGEDLKTDLARKIYQKFNHRVRIYNEYGPTETVVGCMIYEYDFDNDRRDSVPIGIPADNVQIYILDQNQRSVPEGVIGELYISGDGVAKGYLNRPELTVEKFVVVGAFRETPLRRMYRTGDLARFLPGGIIEFLGWSDDQVKIHGFRIELQEIESRLLKVQDVREAVVVARVDIDGTRCLCAYLVAANELSVDELRQFLAQELPDYMIPSYFIRIDKIPLTQNGKVDRKALVDHRRLLEPGENLNIGTAYEPPRNETEAKLVEIWKKLLRVERVSIHDNFFDLGGHSLMAANLVARIHKEFNTKISLRQVFQWQTIEEQAKYLITAGRSIFSAIEPAAPQEYYPVSTAQKRMYILNQLEGAGISYNIPGVVEIEGSIERGRMEAVFQRLVSRHESFRTSFTMIDGEPVQQIQPEVGFKLEYLEEGDDAAGNGPGPSLGGGDSNRRVQSIIQQFFRPFDLSKAPLFRAGLVKLKENLHLLIYDMSHIISDGISMNILIREFAMAYNGEPLPELRIQYKDYSAWQAKERGNNSQAGAWQAKEGGRNSQAGGWQAKERGSDSQAREWQNQLFQSEAIGRQEAYWLNTFAGEIPVLDLPNDYPRPALQSFAGDRIEVEIDEALTRTLYELAAKTGTTLYMLLLAAYTTLLFKYSGQEDIIVGSPIAGRGHADLENIIGMFVNTVALRNHPQAAKKFHDYLNEVKQNALAAFENQDYPFEELVEKLDLRRDLSRNPVFDTMFVLQNMEQTALEIPELKIRPYGFNNPIAKFDLTLTATETINGATRRILFELEYCAALFTKATIERMAGHFINILERIAGSPELSLSELEMLSEQERKQLLYEFSGATADYPEDWRECSRVTIHRLFEEQAERTPEHIALVLEDRTGAHELTYQELNQRANSLARRLREKGVKPDSMVGIMVERSFEMIIGILGILKAGGAYLLIDPESPAERIRYQLMDSQTAILLTQPDFAAINYPGNDLLRIDITDPDIYHQAGSNLAPVKAPSGLAYLLYTSGSIGNLKGVMIEHRSVVNILATLDKLYPPGEKDTYLLKTAATSDVPVTELFGWFIGAGRLVILKPGAEKDPRVILEAIATHHITHIHFIPAMLQVFLGCLADDDLQILNQLHYVFVAGEALSRELVERFQRITQTVILKNFYGPTEAALYAAGYSLSDLGDKLNLSIGEPLVNIKTYIIDPDTHLQPIGVSGELCLGGVGLARGYLNRPELTAEKFIRNPFYTMHNLECIMHNEEHQKTIQSEFAHECAPCIMHNGELVNPEHSGSETHGFNDELCIMNYESHYAWMYKTGDLARRLPDGNIEILGRFDHQLEIRGYRIEPGEIENRLLRHQAVREAVVVAISDDVAIMDGGAKEDASNNKYLCAYFTADQELTGTELREFLARELPEDIIPTYFVRMEKLPLLPNGKINRAALPEPDQSLSAGVNYEAPRNDMEAKLADIWREVLGVEKVGVHDSFYDLGGHSLIAVQIAGQAKQLGLDISVRDILSQRTIAGICANISHEGISNKAAPSNEEISNNADRDSHESPDGLKESRQSEIDIPETKVLPIKIQTEITTYLHYFLPLTVVLTDERLAPWFYEHYINIFTCPGPHDMLRFDFLEFEFARNQFLTSIQFNYELLADLPDVVPFLLEKINQGYYAIVYLDQYYLPEKESYQKEHFVRGSLVYGYHHPSRRLLAIGFDQEHLLAEITFDYDQFVAAYENAKIHYPETAPWAEKEALELLRFKNHTSEYPFDLKRFIGRLDDYLAARGDNSVIYHYELPDENVTYGVGVYDEVVRQLKNIFTDQFRMDYLGFHFLAEHKQGIYDRLRYVASRYGVPEDLLKMIDEYYPIVEQFEAIRIKSLELNYVDDQSGLANLGKVVKESIELIESNQAKERLLLSEISQRLKQLG